LHIIRTLPQKSGWFLLKRPDGAVILRADLTGCDDELAVLSAKKETLNLMEKLIKEKGDNAHDWLPLFFERWRSVVKK
jgi:type IV secretory pathway VirB4 component